jgi:hypothetical protein
MVFLNLECEIYSAPFPISFTKIDYTVKFKY